ncbi:PREDICTED: mitogen-activated protein kinase kinase kinase YODA-like [Camelina sativa]|uniref:Mitogen-activated protein kinase kinase kinase YODA-like n=1 Tax=Camelina sativa TaxID=90675 RepID=A0ABM0XHR2_CAMSA|nr:PREDICTED: mitogen-activated protein kinase kinase kinase YODA-like [Camelina sativa]
MVKLLQGKLDKELLKKMLEIEQSQEHLMQEMSRLKVSSTAEIKQPSHPALRNSCASSLRKEILCKDSMIWRPSAGKKFTEKQYLNILQSMGQSVHAFDLNMRIIFWNAMAEKLYGYSAAEAVGQNPINVMVDDRDAVFAMNVAQLCSNGESWTGKFPVKRKSGEKFSAVTTCSPFYADDGSLIGIVSITSDIAPYLNPRISFAKLKPQEVEPSSSPVGFASKLGLESKRAVVSKLGLDSAQPIQVAIASKISDLASKVRNKVRSKTPAGDSSVTLPEGGSGDSLHSNHGCVNATLSDHKDDAALTSTSSPKGDFIQSPFGVFTCKDEKITLKPFRNSSDESYGKPAIHKVLTSKAEEWMVKKGLSWSWKGYKHGGSKGEPTHSVWPWVQNEQEKEKSHQSNKPTNDEASSMWSCSIIANNTSSASSCGSTRSSVMNKVDTDSEGLDYEVLWDDLTMGEKIGQGSCGTVYHGLWFGSDVAIKVFSKQEYSEEVIQSFRQEVSLMKRLRHPNVLLFMGAVTSPQRLCIVSEFLPRRSIFHLLQRSSLKLDWRRRIRLALDIARGMNYLHRCSPPIIHRDLKSSNLLVDRDWTVKVANFGLSRIKHETYLTTKSGKGTPQWMAPEVLRNESSDEKSDIYSFGVVLWELATEKIPWENLNSMQVIKAVGFMNQRLDIPKDIDPRWVSLMESCWHINTKLRPTFQELMEQLRDLQRKYTMEFQATPAALPAGNSLLKDN